MRRRLKVRRCDLTNEAKRVGGELRSLATETTEAGAKLVAIIGPEEDRLGIEVERQDNLRLEARLHEADEAGVRDRIDFKVAKDSADVTWRKHLADRVDAKRLADEEKRRADAAKELNAVRVARLRELVALGMVEDLQRLHELDAEAWASLEGKAVEAAEVRRQEDERRELNVQRLEVLRALCAIHLAADPTHLGDLSEEEWAELSRAAQEHSRRRIEEERLGKERTDIVIDEGLLEFVKLDELGRLTADEWAAYLKEAREGRAAYDERQRQLEAMELHRSRVRILSEAGAVKHIAPELLADLSQATAEEIEEATEKARTEQAEEEKKRRDAEEIAAQERDERRINRLGALAEILPGWFDGQTNGVDIADISQDEYDKLVTDCIAEADRLDAIAEAERPDREKIVAWAKATIAAIPTLPAIASSTLLCELQACELDIRQRLDLLQVETKENA
jgi:hypothetical protein